MDLAGNLSLAALLRTEDIPGVGEVRPQFTVFALMQNSPNPFNPATTIPFTLPYAGHARLVVYDVAGRLIRVLQDGRFHQPVGKIEWDGRDQEGNRVSSGVYFYRLSLDGKYAASRKMVLLK